MDIQKRIVLMFHGLGGNEKTMVPIGAYCAERIPEARFLALPGPLNLGSEHDPVLGWFVPPNDADRALEGSNRPKLDGLAESVTFVHETIDNLVDQGAETERLHLLGHSQGGAAALASGLTYPSKLGSVCTIAGYLALTSEMRPIATNTKYFLHHSERDDNVRVRWAHYAQTFVQNLGEPCELSCWDIDCDPHSIHLRQLDSICTAIAAA